MVASEAPVPADHVPGKQFWQTPWEVALDKRDHEPAGQSTHKLRADAALVEDQVPALQLTHADDDNIPASLDHVPELQAAQLFPDP